MKFYLAARFSRKAELQGYAKRLEAQGHIVTSRWLGQDDEDSYEKLSPEKARICGEHDVEDVLNADAIINFTEPAGVPSSSRGGRHVELGIAIGVKKILIAIGLKENVFHWLPNIEWFCTFNSFMSCPEMTEYGQFPAPTKESVCAEADRIAGHDRQRDYGHPLDNHQRIAMLWNAFIATRPHAEQALTPIDAGLMMILLKVAREMNTHKRDNLVDICGYTKCVEKMIAEIERREKGVKS